MYKHTCTRMMWTLAHPSVFTHVHASVLAHPSVLTHVHAYTYFIPIAHFGHEAVPDPFHPQ